MTERFYYESDGGGLGKTGRRTHYVVDRYADPLSDEKRTDCESRSGALKLTAQFNENPPWPVWDTVQAERDGYTDSFAELNHE